MLKLKPFVLVFLFPLLLFAQQKKADAKKFHAEFDSLSARKAELLKLKDELKAEVEALNAKSERLDAALKKCLPAFYMKKYGRKIGSRIALGKVWRGMTERMLRDSWGKPDKVTVNRQKYGVFKQYYYGNIIYFFRDGKLIDWEDGGRKR
jgi:hypothetical protein